LGLGKTKEENFRNHPDSTFFENGCATHISDDKCKPSFLMQAILIFLCKQVIASLVSAKTNISGCR
jgi:hypothetical protein